MKPLRWLPLWHRTTPSSLCPCPLCRLSPCPPVSHVPLGPCSVSPHVPCLLSPCPPGSHVPPAPCPVSPPCPMSPRALFRVPLCAVPPVPMSRVPCPPVSRAPSPCPVPPRAPARRPAGGAHRPRRCQETAMAERDPAALPLPQLRAQLREARYRRPGGEGVRGLRGPAGGCGGRAGAAAGP